MKLILVITSLSVLLTSVCMLLFYKYTYNSIMSSVSKNMMDVAQIVRTNFTDEDIVRIKRLKKSLSPYISYSSDEIKFMNNGGIINNLSAETIHNLQASEDFQVLVQKLSKQAMATLHEGADKELEYDHLKNRDYQSNGILVPYLVFIDNKYVNNMLVQTVVSPGYISTADWPGNPIGTTWHTTVKRELLERYQTYVHDVVYVDKFYTMLFSSTPLFDNNGDTVAYIQLEYPAGKELDKLRNLKLLSCIMVLLSFVLSVVVSLFVSKRMSASLVKLSDAATQIKENNYNVSVNISNSDEFGTLGEVFNQMAAAVKTTTTELKNSNERLLSLAADMHDGVGAVLTSIQIAARQDGKTESIRNLAAQGMGEIRFLMDAMEYDIVTFELLAEGITLLAIDILQPQGIKWEQKTEGDNTEIPFQMYLDIQRMVREGFTNIIKHSDSKNCHIELIRKNDQIIFEILSDGKLLDKSLAASGGKGLKNIKFRTERYDGSFSYSQTDKGFHLVVMVNIRFRETVDLP